MNLAPSKTTALLRRTPFRIKQLLQAAHGFGMLRAVRQIGVFPGVFEVIVQLGAGLALGPFGVPETRGPDGVPKDRLIGHFRVHPASAAPGYRQCGRPAGMGGVFEDRRHTLTGQMLRQRQAAQLHQGWIQIDQLCEGLCGGAAWRCPGRATSAGPGRSLQTDLPSARGHAGQGGIRGRTRIR